MDSQPITPNNVWLIREEILLTIPMQRIVIFVRKKPARGNLAVARQQANHAKTLTHSAGQQILNPSNVRFALLSELTAYANKVLREPRYNPQDNRLTRSTISSRSPLLCVLPLNLIVAKMLLLKGCALFPRVRKQHLNEREMALNRHPGKTMPCLVIVQIQHSGKESQTLQGTQLQPWVNHILPRASILKMRVMETDLLQGSVPVVLPMLSLKPCRTTRK